MWVFRPINVCQGVFRIESGKTIINLFCIFFLMDFINWIGVVFLDGYGLDYRTSDGYPKATWFSLLFVVPSITLLTTEKFLKVSIFRCFGNVSRAQPFSACVVLVFFVDINLQEKLLHFSFSAWVAYLKFPSCKLQLRWILSSI